MHNENFEAQIVNLWAESLRKKYLMIGGELSATIIMLTDVQASAYPSACMSATDPIFVCNIHILFYVKSPSENGTNIV